MGVFSDLKAAPKSFPAASQLGHYLDQLIVRKLDAPQAAAARANAVHTVFQFASDPTGGTFTLTITLFNGKTFTTAGIAYNANAATIEGAIDTAATGVVLGWSNGDISVSGGTLLGAGADVLLTFDGASVEGAPLLTTIDGTGLTGGSLAATPTERTTVGQPQRNGWGSLVNLGIVSTPLPAQGAALKENIVLGSRELRPNVPAWVIRELCQEASVEDGDNATYFGLMEALGYKPDKAPLVQNVKR